MPLTIDDLFPAEVPVQAPRAAPKTLSIDDLFPENDSAPAYRQDRAPLDFENDPVQATGAPVELPGAGGAAVMGKIGGQLASTITAPLRALNNAVPQWSPPEPQPLPELTDEQFRNVVDSANRLPKDRLDSLSGNDDRELAKILVQDPETGAYNLPEDDSVLQAMPREKRDRLRDLQRNLNADITADPEAHYLREGMDQEGLNFSGRALREGSARMVYAMKGALYEFNGADGDAELALKAGKDMAAYSRAVSQDQDWLEKMASGVIGNLYSSTTTMVTGGFLGTAATFAQDAYASAVDRAIKEGATLDEARKIGRSQAAFEGLVMMAFQAIGFGGAEKGIQDAIAGKAWHGAREFLKQGLAELAEEEITSLGQVASSIALEVPHGKDVWETVRDTAVQTVLTMGLVEGTHAAMNAFASNPTHKTAREANIPPSVAKSQGELDSLAARAKESADQVRLQRESPGNQPAEPGTQAPPEPANPGSQAAPAPPEAATEPPSEPQTTTAPEAPPEAITPTEAPAEKEQPPATPEATQERTIGPLAGFRKAQTADTSGRQPANPRVPEDSESAKVDSVAMEPFQPTSVEPSRAPEPASPPAAPEVPGPAGDLDTRGKGVQYHGTSAIEHSPTGDHYSTLNYYGQGYYTTDAQDVATGYSKRGAKKTGNQEIYQVNENRPLNIYDAEHPLSGPVRAAVSDIAAHDDIVHDALEKNPTNLRELYDEIRDVGTRDYDRSADTIQETFDAINSNLRQQGYDGMSHKGGLKTKTPEHKVVIYFNPDQDLTVSKVDKQTQPLPVSMFNAKDYKPTQGLDGKWRLIKDGRNAFEGKAFTTELGAGQFLREESQRQALPRSNPKTWKEWRKEVTDTATTPEEGDAAWAILEARAESSGLKVQDYLNQKVGRFESPLVRDSVYVASQKGPGNEKLQSESPPGWEASGGQAPGNPGPRGEIIFNIHDAGRAVIRAFNDSARINTLAHELGHLFRRDISASMLEAAASWSGAVKLEDGTWEWTRDAEEKFARGFERYLLEGKSPTPKLGRVFEQYKQWLSGIYSKLTGSQIDLHITPEMKAVYDSLFLPKGAKAEPAEVLGFGAAPTAKKQKPPRLPRNVTTPPTPKGFVNRDVKPAVSGLVETIRQAGDSVLKTWAPHLRSAEAGQTTKNLREAKANWQQALDNFDEQFQAAENLMSKDSDDNNINRWQRAQTGKLNSNDPLDMVLKEIQDLFERQKADLERTKPGSTKGFMENYWPNQWKDTRVANETIRQWWARKTLEGRKTFLKKRTIPTIRDGIEAGFVPVTTNPITLARSRFSEIRQYVESNDAVNKDMAAGSVRYLGLRKAPEGWVKLTDPRFVKYGPPTVALKEYVDAVVYDGLTQIAQNLGIEHERLPQTGRALGFSEQGNQRVVTRNMTPLNVLAHEIGHQLDYLYGLREIFGLGGKGRRGNLTKEISAIADMRFEGRDMKGVPDSAKAYTRKSAEKMAMIVEAFVHAPEKMREVAPNAYAKFAQFVTAHDEISGLLDIKPSLNMKAIEFEKSVGGLSIMGYHYASEEVATVYNNFTSKGLESTSRVFATLQDASRLQTTFNLGWSAFHGVMTAIQSMNTELSVALLKAVGGDAKGAAKSLLHVPIAGALYPHAGAKVRKAWVNEDLASPEYREIVAAMKKGGARAMADKRFSQKFSRQVVEEWKNSNVPGAAWRLPLAVTEQVGRPIMEMMVPSAKNAATMRMLQYEFEKKPNMTPRQIQDVATKVQNSVDNRFGSVVHDNQMSAGWVRSVQNLLFRAFQYQAGTIREYGGAAVDTVKGIYGLNDGQITHRQAYAASSAIMAATLGGLLQYLMTGKPPEDAKDLFFPQDGGVDRFGNPTRLRIPGYINDLVSIWHSPITAFEHKMNPVISEIAQLIHNRDYFGEKIYGEESQGLGTYLSKQLMPFSVQNIIKMRDRGEGPGAQLAAALGVAAAPGYINESPAQEKMYEYISQEFSDSPKTSEDIARGKARKATVDAMRAGQPVDKSLTDKFFDSGDMKRIEKDAKLPPFAVSFSYLDPTQAMAVYKLATPEERDKVADILLHKFLGAGMGSEVKKAHWDSMRTEMDAAWPDIAQRLDSKSNPLPNAIRDILLTDVRPGPNETPDDFSAREQEFLEHRDALKKWVLERGDETIVQDAIRSVVTDKKFKKAAKRPTPPERSKGDNRHEWDVKRQNYARRLEAYEWAVTAARELLGNPRLQPR